MYYLACAKRKQHVVCMYISKCKKKFGISVLVRTAIKNLKKKTLEQAAEMKRQLSACILILTLAVLYVYPGLSWHAFS